MDLFNLFVDFFDAYVYRSCNFVFLQIQTKLILVKLY